MNIPLANPDDLHAWLSPLRSLPLRRLRVQATLRSSVRFQDPIHAVTRGLMAARLREMRCLTWAPDCAGCAETARCDYAQLIGVPGAPADVVRPFWLQDLSPHLALEAGAVLDAAMVWHTPSVPRSPHLHAALLDALESLGADPMPHDVRVVTEGPVTWSAWRSTPAAVRLTARTPLCLLDGRPDRDRERLDRSDTNCPEAPWLALLAGMGAHRLNQVLQAFTGRGLPRVQLPHLQGVRCVDGGMRRETLSRFSQAQQRRMPMECVTGTAVVEGDGVIALLPLLEALSHCNVGKHTALGFGHLVVEPLT